MKRVFIFIMFSVMSFTSYSFAQETIQKTYCMSAFGYKSPDDLKKELLVHAKRLAVSEIFGELITSFTRVENLILTEDKIRASSTGFIRIKGDPIYENGKNLGEVCVTINAYATEEDINKLKPVKISKKQCVSDPNLTTKQIKEYAKEQAIISALLNYDRRLERTSKKELLSLVRRVEYLETGFIPDTETYCAKFEGIIYPIEILALTQSKTTTDRSPDRSSIRDVNNDYIDLSKWEILDGQWEAKNGSFYGSGGAIILKEGFKNYIIEITVEHISGPKWAGIGIGLRSNIIIGGQKRYRNKTSDNQGYGFNFTFNKTYNLFNGIGGNWYVIHPEWKEWQHSAILADKVNQIRVEVLGDTVRILVNSELLSKFTDTTHASGSPLLWVQETSQIIKFSDIRIIRK